MPIGCFTGLRPVLEQFLRSETHELVPAQTSLDRVRGMQLMQINQLQTVLDNMHKTVHELVEKNRLKMIKHHNKQTNVVTPNFIVGDLVLIRRAQDKDCSISICNQTMRCFGFTSSQVSRINLGCSLRVKLGNRNI